MDGWLIEWMDEQRDGQMDGCLDRQTGRQVLMEKSRQKTVIVILWGETEAVLTCPYLSLLLSLPSSHSFS